MYEFQPDYINIVKSAQNQDAARTPLYEHIISTEMMESVLGKSIHENFFDTGGETARFQEIRHYLSEYCRFARQMGYDTISFEQCIGPIMPGSGSLGGHKKGVIQNRQDFNAYPWNEIPEMYFKACGVSFQALRDALPPGMKAVGGVGNGVFECVQDITGYMDLCFISEDDPELYADLFAKVGQVSLAIWERFMEEYGDCFCVLRFGDDLGYKSNTLISAEDIRKHVIPPYKKIIDLVHRYGKPFLLHSCGCLFGVMDDLINTAGIDAKHSNEDQIAPFPVWVERYGDRIGNFGGIDTDAVCRLTYPEMKEYITDVYRQCKGKGGFAFGSGNSIPSYVPVEGYLNMVRIFRELRGEFC